MSAKNEVQQSVGFTDEERAAMKERAKEQWEKLDSPIPLTDSPRLALSVRPLAVSIPPFTAKGGVLSANLALRCLLMVSSGEPEAVSSRPPLPELSPLPPNLDPGVLVNLDAFISYGALEEFLSGRPMDPLDLPGGAYDFAVTITLQPPLVDADPANDLLVFGASYLLA